ncbi:unnamed protein product [Prorocentrum cordatum]|uniref:Uncharacterized protein n=1 Tax=Prorocentrum cordatum TaxID=2364126 RepID=A0ABN9VRD8_9DINO|nr:unnamed protein product [Polarella glacialis]
MSALRAAALAAPTARILNVVDDVSCRATGPRTMVAQQLAAAYRAFCAKMEGASLPLSRNMTKALATSSKLRDALRNQLGWDLAEGDFVGVRRDLGGNAVSGRWKRAPLTIVTKTALMVYVEMLPEAAARSCLAVGLSNAERMHSWRLVEEPISAVVLAVERDCRRAMGLEEVKRRSSSMWGWGVPPFWQPILDLVSHRSEVWDLCHQRALRCLIQNTYWCQARVGAGGPSFPKSCQLCDHPVGPLFHRRFRCEAHDGWGREFLEPLLRDAAARVELMGHPVTELFARGCFPTSPSWSREGLDQSYPSLRGAGWSIIVFNKHRRLVAEAWGSVPLSEGPEQLARGGEDCAVKVLTDTIAGGSFKLYCDCLATVRHAVNPLAAAAAGSPRARLWAGRAEMPKDAEVIKVRARLGQQAVGGGLLAQFELDGNALAGARAEERASAVRADCNDVYCIEGCLFIARLAARRAAAQEVRVAASGLRDSMGVEALEIIGLGEWPVDLAEACEEDAAPSASAGPACTGEVHCLA